uniref:HAT C-terminal dimerisation domain-containing protein n=1 Tax=Cyprinus carpio TaxID=7962 RepID=A0A8C1TVX2_CYPCA
CRCHRDRFDFIARKDKNISVKCTLCPGDKCLSTAANSMSNLSKHLSAQHGNTKLVVKDPAHRSFEGVTHHQPTPPKQAKLFSSLGAQQVTQNEMNRLVAGFIVEDMLPLSTIESSRFRKILDKIPATRKPTSESKTFSHYMDKCYSDMESKLKRMFESLDHVCTTVDIWSLNNKSYLGMTVHWIDGISFKHEKAALACKRVRGRHTYDVIASEIEQVHSSFGLSQKVTACVTDNGSNFVKAFRMFESHPDDGSDSDEPSDEEGEEEVTSTDVAEALSTESDETFSLPPHLHCASHTLNLIAKNDPEKWMTSNNDCKAVYRSALAKCAALWTKTCRSTVASDQVEDVLKRKLIIPTATRWNSTHEALSLITEIPIRDLNTIFSRLSVKSITEREYQFLKEYCAVLSPLAAALDILQGEDDCYYGTLLPTLEILMSKLLALKDAYYFISQTIKDRFASVLESKDALMAAATMPKLKVPLSPPVTMTFFEFEEEFSYTAETEVMEYLKMPGSEWEVLSRFPRIKEIAKQYNTPIPSSTPVERLFSLGSIVLTPRRNGLSDKRFERLLLMRYNRYFEE